MFWLGEFPPRSWQSKKPRLVQLSYNLIEIYGVYWCLLVFIGVYWCLLVFIGVYWCLLVFIGVYWCLLVFIGVYWCLLVFIGVLAYTCCLELQLYPGKTIIFRSLADRCSLKTLQGQTLRGLLSGRIIFAICCNGTVKKK